MTPSTIYVTTLNVRGLIDKQKCEKVYTWLIQQQCDIIFIQEMHCTATNVENLKKLWHGQSCYGVSDSPYSKGVAILFKPKLKVNITDEKSMNNGRTLMVNIEHNNTKYTLVNIYAPNRINERCEYYKKMKNNIESFSHNLNNLLICGDLNCSLKMTEQLRHI